MPSHPHRETRWPTSLGLRPGDWVEVRSEREILATLDREGALGGMPFMPEMLRHCGQRFQVSKRAEKACDTIQSGQGRRIRDAVHLADLRCDGSAHGGCQAHCLMWWREAWLRPVSGPDAPRAEPAAGPEPVCSVGDLETIACTEDGSEQGPLFSCQVTRLRDFTEPLWWWDPRHYWREVWCGNVSVGLALRTLARAWVNALRRRLGLAPRPTVRGRLEKHTPRGEALGLQRGDWVQVKSKSEIEETLNQERLNRGLWFDVEMLPYCGKRLRLLDKVEKIIDEKTGRMQRLPNDCWILAGAWCTSYLSRYRLFCTRAIYPYWREIWLRRADDQTR